MPEDSLVPTIGDKTVNHISEQITGLLNDHLERINMAFLKGEGALKVSLKVEVHGSGSRIKHETEISYYPEPQVKDRSELWTVDEEQGELEFDQ